VPEPAAAPSHRLPRTMRERTSLAARLEEEEKHIYLFYFKIVILKTKASLQANKHFKNYATSKLSCSTLKFIKLCCLFFEAEQCQTSLYIASEVIFDKY
jgi:hypothetical protein